MAANLSSSSALGLLVAGIAFALTRKSHL